jgi:hypothetical protein
LAENHENPNKKRRFLLKINSDENGVIGVNGSRVADDGPAMAGNYDGPDFTGDWWW